MLRRTFLTIMVAGLMAGRAIAGNPKPREKPPKRHSCPSCDALYARGLRPSPALK